VAKSRLVTQDMVCVLIRCSGFYSPGEPGGKLGTAGGRWASQACFQKLELVVVRTEGGTLRIDLVNHVSAVGPVDASRLCECGPDALLVLVLCRLPRVNDLRFAHLAIAVADEHIALVYSTTYLLS